MKTTKEIAQAMYDELYLTAAATVATGEEHPPLLFTFGPKIGKAMLLVAEFDKDTIAHIHRKTAAHPAVESTALVMECWMTKANPTNPMELATVRAIQEGLLQVSDLPVKNEGVLFNIRVGTDQFLGMCEIDRTAKRLSKGDLLDLSHPAAGEHYEGRMVGDGDPKAQAARRMAN